MKDLYAALREEFARTTAREAHADEQETHTALATAAEKELFLTRTSRRVRYWVDGLVIGSELFVRDTVARARVQCKIKKRRLVRAVAARGPAPSGVAPIYSFKQLRVLIE